MYVFNVKLTQNQKINILSHLCYNIITIELRNAKVLLFPFHPSNDYHSHYWFNSGGPTVYSPEMLPYNGDYATLFLMTLRNSFLI